MVFLANGLFYTNAANPTSPSDSPSKIESENWDRVREYLHSAVYFPDYTIRLYYRADCGSTDGGPIRFPFVRVEAPAKGETGLAAARHIFRDSRNVVIREDSERIIRIWIGDVPSSILHTKIGLVKLDKHARETKLGAVETLLKTKEVQAEMKKLGVGTPSYASSEMAITPPPYPAKMANVTLDQALDVIAKAWDGILVYGACTEPDESGTKLFDIEAGNRVFFEKKRGKEGVKRKRGRNE